VAEDPSFARLVSLACHDLRTPLATVHGFARTLAGAKLGDPASRYIELMESASVQLGELLDRVSLVAQIEGGRYDPELDSADLLAIARAAADRVQEGEVDVVGPGGTARTAASALELALHDLARCVIRHGGVPGVTLRVDGIAIELGAVPAEVAPILLGENLRDLGAAVAARTIGALGGSVSVESERLVIRLPAAGDHAA
jgi:signal transduction histidine kinase